MTIDPGPLMSITLIFLVFQLELQETFQPAYQTLMFS